MATSSDHQLLQCPAPRPMTTMDRRWRAHIDPAPNCPRCASPNTKFCYYNNYSLSQPRFFCKGCRRYWTKGGSLRNVPVGGGCRKSRRSRSKNSANSATSSRGAHNMSPNSSSESSQGSPVGPDIDLADVFAKFLTNGTSSNVNEVIISEATTTTTNTPFEEASNDSLTDNGLTLYDDQTQFQEEEDAVHGFITTDLSSFDDITIEDVFWSDGSDLSSLTWQPEGQLQEFDSPLLPVDQSKISSNLFSSDNWSCFDTTGFEVFSRP